MRLPALAACLLLAAAPPARPAGAPGSAGSLPPRLVSSVPADVPAELLAAHLSADVGVRAHVRRDGTIDSVRAVSGDARLRAAAEASGRWWIFERQPRPRWTFAHVHWDGQDVSEPLSPDVIALAREAERAGDPGAAIDDWCGALARAGQHPSIRNEYAIRERILKLAARITPPRPVPAEAFGEGQGARNQQERTVARAEHEDLVATLDRVLVQAPWWADAYQWRAASQFGCGRAADGLRSVLLMRAAATDRAMRDRADRALARFATGDTLGTYQLLKTEGIHFNPDPQ